MALITNEDTSILPYNDDQMVYDLDKRMYVLTEKGVKDLTGYDISVLSKTKEKSDINRYRISYDLMNLIKRYSRLDAFKYKQRAIAKDEKTRSGFKDALVEQAIYYFESGAGSLKTQHGINISSGKTIDIDVLRGKILIAVYAQTILEQLGLLYTGNLYDWNYEEDGTW